MILDEIAEYIDKRIVKCDYTIDGKTYPAKLRRSILEGDKVIKDIYLTYVDPVGTVTRARLLGEDDKVIDQSITPRVHEKNGGLLIRFVYQINSVEEA